MRRFPFYTIAAVVSLLVRQFILPNPFECFGDKALLINWIAEPIIHTIAFILVGSIYRAGSAPVVGSILYLLMYSLVVGVLLILNAFNYAWWSIAAMVILLGLVVYAFIKIREWIDL